jgi:predicted permease
MNVVAYLRSLAAKFLHRSETESDMDEELRSHIQHRADDLERSGLNRAEAERRARVEFGGYEKVRQESHEALGGNFLETLVQDMRFSMRILLKSPGFTIAAVLTLALAIGANSVVFGVLDALVLRPLHMPQSESLYGPVFGDGSGFQSYPNYRDLRERNHSFEDLAAFAFMFAGVDTGNDPESATGFETTGNYFDVLRARPYLGRFFHTSDEHGPNSAPYLVISYPYWHTRFHDDRGVVGRAVQINKHPFTIIGVAPPGFQGTLLFVNSDFFLPIVDDSEISGTDSLNDRGNQHTIFEIFGHLKPGVTLAQANADVNAIGADIEKTYPKEMHHTKTSLAHPGLTSFGGPVHAFVAGLMLLSGLILLAACANLGSLFAAHAADRGREVALRLALGSSRNRILRQLMTEAMLISLTGGTVGLAGSMILLRRVAVWQPFAGAPIHVPVNTDAAIYLVALLLALLSGFLFGIVPVRQVLRTNPYEIVKAGSSARLGRRMPVRDVLLVTQIAICAVLVTSSLVAVRGLTRSINANYGFDPHNSMLLGVNLAVGGYRLDQAMPVQKRLIEAMASIPGVEQVGVIEDYPPLVYASGSTVNAFKDDARDLTPKNAASAPYQFAVSPGYFEAAGTTLMQGRNFLWSDDKNAPSVAVANRTFAIKMFGAIPNAIGKYFRTEGGKRLRIVGVVEDGKYLSLAEEQQPAIFYSSMQEPSTGAYLMVRSHRNQQQLGEAMRNKLRQTEPGIPGGAETWDSLLGVVMFPARVAAMSLGVLGMMGAILSITGIFGMAANSVSKRLKELGIRIALGAQRTEVLQAALGRAMKLLTLGSVAGLVLGFLASRVLSYIVYQATPRDPVVLGGVVLAMALLGLLATWIPAQRALTANPLVLLREE